jgi:hypothetical protein
MTSAVFARNYTPLRCARPFDEEATVRRRDPGTVVARSAFERRTAVMDIRKRASAARSLAAVLAVVSGQGCATSDIVGPLSHQEEEREHLLARARATGMSDDLLEKVVPPLTTGEEELSREQDGSCRTSYVWKNALTWTGSSLIAASASLTIGGAYATGNDDTTGKLFFGVSAGSLAALGSGLVAIAGIIQQRYTDRGCVSRLTAK